MRSEYGAAPRAASASSRIKLLVAAQAALVSLLLAFMVLTSMGDSLSDASIEDVSQQVVESAGEDGKTMQEEDGRALKRNFGLSANDYEGVSYYGPVSNMDATEILVVKLEDTSQQQAVRDAIDTRISQQLSTFEGYAPVQAGQLQDAVVDVEGNYVLYAVGPNAQSVRSAFLKSL